MCSNYRVWHGGDVCHFGACPTEPFPGTPSRLFLLANQVEALRDEKAPVPGFLNECVKLSHTANLKPVSTVSLDDAS